MNPWEREIYLPFEGKDTYKSSHPGLRWSGLGGLWYEPVDFQLPYCEPEFLDVPGLHHFQSRAVARAMLDNHGFLCNFDTGLGKTYTAFGLATVRKSQRILVCCPAMLIDHWVQTGEKLGYTTDQLTVVNYESLVKHPNLIGYDFIVADEAHRMKNAAKGKLQNAPRLVQQMWRVSLDNPTAFRFAATATPIGNKPIDLWGQLDWLHKGRWGSYWGYAYRYHEVTKDPDRGHLVIGPPRDDTAPELKSRLQWMSMSWSKVNERGEGLPPIVSYSSDVVSYIRGLNASPEKLLVFCFNRAVVEQLATQFPEAIAFHGEQTPIRRNRLIAQANAENRMIIATMGSAGLGIDSLANRSVAVYAQLAWDWQTLDQAMGRNDRLSSTEKPQNHFIVANPYEQRKVELFSRKLAEIRKVLPVGVPLDELLIKKYTDEDFERELATLDLSGMDWSRSNDDSDD